ncbi:GNAT family N-acetyltransferase [Candidatus Poribacteria bacterium]|nr:GNAT family N-acetyltransferase [Candidatus Poribacteria bacterium]MBT5531518.1 GNAT family N-acetyltransferase [Candidatus Poribacteria bacterium]MBT5710162.1 GNAT family N-acetyltransferase [Candidatus Poribacteria bacterium]MBT7101723.1 GNAT family N-acetyltransferase [Candidatus Poribacteria bacterium]MBT7807921.1 GNAT family N-acetyltransferase [Candidatus Poribacteria bacterium]
MPQDGGAPTQGHRQGERRQRATPVRGAPGADDRLVGFLALDGIRWTRGVCSLGVLIGRPEVWGRGCGSAAIQVPLAFAFDELNLHRVELAVFSYIQRAIAMYERLGSRVEGTRRERLHRDGHRHDMHLYGLLRREWDELAGARPTAG